MTIGDAVIARERPAAQQRADGDGHEGPPSPRRRMDTWLIAAVHGYQTARSGRPTGCRYLPSCSEYAVAAIDRYGAARGGWLAVRRLARCNPWGGHGVDPVPDRRAPCWHH